jgi:colicin import membrane protein
LLGDASERMAEARQLAEEAAEAARAAADEAHRQAEQLAEEAQQQASDADAQVSAAEELRDRPKAGAKDTTNGGLEAYHKPELVELAASIGIEGRTNMTKSELVAAIAKASRTRG